MGYMSQLPKIEVESSLNIQKQEEKKDTALNYGNGQLDNLLATQSLVALMIEASVKLIDSNLPEGLISVGKALQVLHENPTILGLTVSVNVTVKKYDGRKVLLEIKAYDEVGQIGTGLHERVIVNKKLLLEKANKRADKLESMDY
jgi:predicted thioesterase